MNKRSALVALLSLSALLMPGTALAHPAQHGPGTGHLSGTGAWGAVDLLGQVRLTDAPGLVADVAAYGSYAYLAHWGDADCSSVQSLSTKAGAWVVDISDPANPRKVNFIAMPQDTRPGEGVQVVHIETTKFRGEILVMNAEQCGTNYKGGVMLYDVTNPLAPVKLKEGFGERTRGDAHQTHSAFAWQPAGSARAYLVSQDEEDLADVDFYDISNPKRPRMLAELDLNDFDVAQPELNLAESFLHDMTVKCMTDGAYAGKCILLASYWDGGYVLLDVTNPAQPAYIRDTEYAAIDPEVLEQTGIPLTPEGNGHQGEFTADNRFFLGTDEDFSPYRAQLTTDDGGSYDAGEFGWTVPLGDNPGIDGPLNGPTVFGGYGCPADRGSIPNASTLTLASGEEPILVLQRGPLSDPSQSGDACFFSEKVETAQLAGYDVAVIANHHTGALGGDGPDSYFCGGQGHTFTITASALCVGHRAMHELFDDPNAADNFTYPEATPAVGTVGDRISVASQFDGWGYVHLYDAATGQELDTFAIPEAMDPAYATGFGDLSVHEVATHPTNPSLAYLSYYAGGMRALQIQCSNPADPTTCELVEVGGYLDAAGNNFWGVEMVANPADELLVVGDEQLVLGSDRDYGLFIFSAP